MHMWYIVVVCSETIVHSLVRTVFTKVGFCSVLSILRASFGIWWVRKLIWELRRYIWVIRSRAELGVRFRGVRFRDLGKRVACVVATCHLGKCAKLCVVTNQMLPCVLEKSTCWLWLLLCWLWPSLWLTSPLNEVEPFLKCYIIKWPKCPLCTKGTKMQHYSNGEYIIAHISS